MPLVTAGKNSACDGIASATTHISLHSTLSDTGTNELSGGSPAYARKPVVWSTASSGQRANQASLTFDVPSASTVLAFGMWTALTGGTFLGWMPLNPGVKGFGTVDAATDAVTSYGHGLTAGTALYVDDVFSDALPTGLAKNTVYYVSATGLTTDAFKLSATVGGAVLEISSSSEVFFQSIIPESFGAQGTLSVAIGGLVIDATGI